MANHIFVIPKKMPTAEQVDKDAREICARKFPQLTLHFKQEEGSWLLQYKDDPYIGLIFWISKWGDPKTWNEKSKTCSRVLPCIEFRHRTGWLWWVEYEIREELALRYNAKVVDESNEEEFDAPQTERYRNYSEYLAGTRGPDMDKAMKEWLNTEIRICLENSPEELRPLIGKEL
jgi:hypothetical protein